MERKLQTKNLDKVTGGTDNETGGDGIQIQPKTLEGKNDEYQVAPSDRIQELISKYQQEKKTEI